ncbi:arginyl tRNA synthetase [Aureococcus anophagefferens]|uniref:arginine--tRNA ligase n=1 Tax=Aureococcus anophagefferens TaxID=44056 RepID=A0ABR1FSK2_AURAN
MDDLVAQCEAAGEAVKTAKAGGDKAAIKAAVDALVAIKTKITALDPSHPMALVDKAAKKKAEKEAKKKQEAAAPAADGGARAEQECAKGAGEEGAQGREEEGAQGRRRAAGRRRGARGARGRRAGRRARRRGRVPPQRPARRQRFAVAKVATVAAACGLDVSGGGGGPGVPGADDGCVLDASEGEAPPGAAAAVAAARPALAHLAARLAAGAGPAPGTLGARADRRRRSSCCGPSAGEFGGAVAALATEVPADVETRVAALGAPAAAAWAPEADESTIQFVTRLFAAAIAAAVPEAGDVSPGVMRCGNAAFGDYQCNAPMGIFKTLKANGVARLPSPRAVGEAIAAAVPANGVLKSASVAPAGFINAHVEESLLSAHAQRVAASGVAAPPPLSAFGGARKVLVDFSSPNIAKEMHVGHLRSTIIGDTICRVLEFCGHDVRRVNHVGDWGTQFGMLITHMEEAYPDFLQNPPNITDLTTFYKNAKKRFDEDEQFKEVSRKTVVALQAGDARCRAIWSVLCDISRKEFDKVYARLDVKVEEFGESYYNAMIPGAIGLLEDAGLVNAESGAACVFLPGHSFPLIIRKSDGGYGYDSTDMAAIHHRLRTLGVEWVVYVTDLGQAEHFHMCFEAARAAKWDDASAHVRLHHVGFGVVQGEDGKRFKTRSGETVRLVDLLDASVERMEKSLSDRVAEGKCALPPSEVKRAAAAIGYGAVKYFDLHQHPSTNYKFSYDKMLSTSGNTAVYLLFAHARLASIVAKARETRKVDAKAAAAGAALVLTQHGKERALAFELTQFAEVVLSVADDFLPVRICDYLYKIATKFTEFVTECKVLDDPRMAERLVLCEATGVVMRKCFDLLGITYLMQI